MKNHAFRTLFLSTIVLLISGARAKCPPSFDCGNLGTMHFPYTDTKHPLCGLLVIHGCGDRDPDAIKTIKNKGTWFYITRDHDTVLFRDDDLRTLLLSRRCGVFSTNYTGLDTTSPFLSLRFTNVTLFRCNRALSVTPSSNSSFSKSTTCPDDDIFYDTANTTADDESLSYSEFEACSMVRLPIRDAGLVPNPDGSLFEYVSADIPVRVEVSRDCSSCYYLSGGRCQLDNQGKFFCAQEKASEKVKIVVAGTTFSTLIIYAIAYYLFNFEPMLLVILIP
ncbi:uncharacterized protein LOC109790113 [Cajanus cajan]|uniref:uncharacterized protein LOC109790113 n=1 Tax=Cajanus cajan TaxID=3821 RepID=UPI0010FBA03A|nr:uncharacterized protein LOC109790113 [Cajanus cajan]